MKTQQEKLKYQILALVKQSGLPVQTQYIVDHVTLPKRIDLNHLLEELVTERRLRKSYTLLNNGDPDCTYDLIS